MLDPAKAMLLHGNVEVICIPDFPTSCVDPDVIKVRD